MKIQTIPDSQESGPPECSMKLPGQEQRSRQKAQDLWALLRSTVQKINKDDFPALSFSHGLQLVHHLSLPAPLTHVTYEPGQHCLISLDSAAHIQLHHPDGRVRDRVTATAPLCGLWYAWQHYVAWNHHELVLLDSLFSPVVQYHVEQGVLCCVYASEQNQVITGGCGGVTVWSFSHHKKDLSRQQVLNQGLNEQDKVTALVLDSSSLPAPTCFAASGTSVWEYTTSDGSLLRVRRNLHLRRITGLLYSEVLHLLITGSTDGDIKVWDKELQLRTLHDGHAGAVTALTLCSSGTIFFSGSEDGTLRMWDLETQAQVGEQHTDGSALGLEAFSADGQFLISHTRRGLDVWQVQHLYKLRTVMGTAVTKMKVSGQHSHRRAICVCGDSAVRILAADTGDMISTLLLDKGSKVRAAEYCMYRESVFVLLEQGDLLKANALENPMSIVSRVKSNTTGTLPICLTLYTSILDEARALSEWRRIVEQRGDKKQSGKDVRLPKGKNSFFPITGGEDGTLCVLDWYTNQALYQLKAHSPESVTSLISSVQNHYVISAGSDLKVKVWRFSPDSKECLSPHMTFVCSQPIGLMCTMGSQLFVAIRDPSTANYSLVLYCLETQTKADHIPSDDHQDEITGLCSCSKLQLVATCGKEKMIQIWNEDNQLLRTLCLNSVPQSLAFSSNRGELLLGIHNHVYHIDLSKLLPTLYQLKIMCTEPSLLDKESQIPVPEEILISLSKYDKRRLTEPCSAFGNSIRPLTTIEENIKRQLENKEQSQEFVRLCARDQELNLIQNGMLRPNKKRKSNKEIRKEATKRYLQLLFREKPHMKFPAVDPFDPDGDQMTSTFLQPQESPFLPSVCNPGFFPKLALSETSLSFGFIPNSALLQFICPNDTMEQQHDLEKRFWTRIHKATFEDPVLVQSPELVISEKKEEVEKKEEKEDTGEWEESYDRQSILQKISQVEVRKKSVPIEDTSPVLSPPPTPVKPKKTTIAKLPVAINNFSSLGSQFCSKASWNVQSSPQGRAQTLLCGFLHCAAVGLKRPVHSRRPLLRPQQSKLPVKSAETVQPDNPAPPISPQKEKTPSPIAKAPTPREPQELLLIPKEIPLFIRYFQDEDWFTLICPETKEEVQRLSDSEFESRLLQGILHSDLPMCRELLHALRMLHQHGHMEDPKETYQTLIRLMEKMNLQVPEEREFVFTCLSFMNDLFSGTKDLIVELLVTCVLVHPTQRAPLLVLLREMGLQDPHGILPREINSWDNWEMTERTKESLRQSWEEWIEDWTFQLKDFVSASLMSVQREASEEGSRARRHHIRGGRLRDKVRVTLEQIEATIDVTTIEVLNYFCEIQMAKDIQVEVPQHASTVLALPPIQSKRALLRLERLANHFDEKIKMMLFYL